MPQRMTRQIRVAPIAENLAVDLQVGGVRAGLDPGLTMPGLPMPGMTMPAMPMKKAAEAVLA